MVSYPPMDDGQTAPLIALLTDFGTQDPFVGIMKGVMAGIAPGVPLVDVTHEIPPGEVLHAAVALWQAVPYFPAGTVFLCVVDPGVGTARAAVLVDTPAARFVGPDNGLFTFVLGRKWRAWELENPAYRLPGGSNTFHGRDIFAPAAAHAARGTAGPRFGSERSHPVRLPPPRLGQPVRGGLSGEVLYADRFGNLLTSLGRFREAEHGWVFSPWVGELQERTLLPEGVRLPDGRKLPLVRTFGQLAEGECGALVGSSGLLEIVANRASAREILGLGRGDRITLIERRVS